MNLNLCLRILVICLSFKENNPFVDDIPFKHADFPLRKLYTLGSHNLAAVPSSFQGDRLNSLAALGGDVTQLGLVGMLGFSNRARW